MKGRLDEHYKEQGRLKTEEQVGVVNPCLELCMCVHVVSVYACVFVCIITVPQGESD